MRTGEGIVYYASGTGLIFAVGEIMGFPYRNDDPAHQGWPWRVKVKLSHWRDSISDGVPLEALNVEERDLRQVIKRRSHIRLSEAEYNEAVRLLSQPSRLALGPRAVRFLDHRCAAQPRGEGVRRVAVEVLVARHIAPRGARVGVAHRVLYVLQRDASVVEACGEGVAQAVRAELAGGLQAGGSR